MIPTYITETLIRVEDYTQLPDLWRAYARNLAWADMDLTLGYGRRSSIVTVWGCHIFEPSFRSGIQLRDLEPIHACMVLRPGLI